MTDDDIIDAVLRYEGGFVNDPADHGGPTQFGVTAANLGRWRKLGRVATVDEVKSMTISEARNIYRDWYIAAPGFDAVEHEPLKWVLVDSAVLHGPRTSVKWLQQALGVTVDGVMGAQTMNALAGVDPARAAAEILSLRIRRYATIVINDSTQLRFLQGWINRATSLLTSG
jgi:lysozyme family protein